MSFKNIGKQIGKSAVEINQGYCWLWALLAVVEDPSAKIMYAGTPNGGGHNFIEAKGKFYDSEKPNGVPDWKTLPSFSNFDPEQLPEADVKTPDEVMSGPYVRQEIMKLRMMHSPLLERLM